MKSGDNTYKSMSIHVELPIFQTTLHNLHRKLETHKTQCGKSHYFFLPKTAQQTKFSARLIKICDNTCKSMPLKRRTVNISENLTKPTKSNHLSNF